MVQLVRFTLLCAVAAVVLPLSACGGGNGGPTMPSSMKNQGADSANAANFSSSSALTGTRGPTTVFNGKEVSSIKADNIDSGIVVPDGAGGVVLIQGEKRMPQNAGYTAARELKLKVRELAEQLISGIKDRSIQESVALPVSFVNMDNFDQSSSFGRFMAEQLFYEFNQRGFPTQEYRIPKSIVMREGEGDFYLSRELGAINIPACSVIVAGTYYADKNAVMVNARLIRPNDGRVLRTASLVLQNNVFTKRMLAGGMGSAPKVETGSILIRDFKEVTQPTAGQTPFEQGADIHSYKR